MRGYQRECYLDTWMALAGEAIAINNGWTMSGKTCRLQDFHTHGGGNPKTGQAGGLP